MKLKKYNKRLLQFYHHICKSKDEAIKEKAFESLQQNKLIQKRNVKL